MDLYHATIGAIGGQWDSEGAWNECKLPGGTSGAMYTFSSDRRDQTLPTNPDTMVGKIRELWRSRGHDVAIVREPSLTPPRLILSDPAWMSGSYPDGRLFQFSVGNAYADFRATSRCIPGDYYYLNTGKHL